MEQEWYASHDGEHFGVGGEESREAIIALYRTEYASNRSGKNRFWIGTKAEYVPFLSPTNMIEAIVDQEQCDAIEEVGGDFAEDWPCLNAKDEAVIEAGLKIQAIMQELVGQPHFWKIEHIEELPVEEPPTNAS